MKRASLALLILLAALPLTAGVTYQFRSVTDGRGGSELSGTASVEGPNMRLEFDKGDRMIFKDKSVVISKDGGKTMLILDPKKKSYYELDLQQLFGAFGNVMKSVGGMFELNIANQKVDVKNAGSGGLLEGYPTTRYVVDSRYDMSMKVMGMASSSRVHSITESWTTDKLGSELITFIQLKGLRTGVDSLDKLIESQTRSVKGFPLKQVTTTTTTSGKKSQTNTTTVTITGITKKSVAASQFQVPAGFRKEESPFEAMGKKIKN